MSCNTPTTGKLQDGPVFYGGGAKCRFEDTSIGQSDPFHSPIITQEWSGPERTDFTTWTIFKLPNWALKNTPPPWGQIPPPKGRAIPSPQGWLLRYMPKKKKKNKKDSREYSFPTSHEKLCHNQCYTQQMVIWVSKRELNNLFPLLLLYSFLTATYSTNLK